MCPDCNGHEAHTLDTGRDEQGRVVRKRQCKSCGLEYATIEIPVPVSFHRIDSFGRDKRRDERRRAQGFRGVQNRKPYRAPTIDVRVTVRETRA